MALRTRSHSNDQVSMKIPRWVEGGIISVDQGERILDAERAHGAVEGRVVESGPPFNRTMTAVIELVSCLAIVLVVASGALFVSRLWHGLGIGGRLGVGATIATLGFAGGWFVHRIKEVGAARLGPFLWLCGTGGVAMFTAVLVDGSLPRIRARRSRCPV